MVWWSVGVSRGGAIDGSVENIQCLGIFLWEDIEYSGFQLVEVISWEEVYWDGHFHLLVVGTKIA